jgi:hypothetical protein
VVERFYYHNLPEDYAFLDRQHDEGCPCTLAAVD